MVWDGFQPLPQCLCVTQAQANTLAIIDEFTLMESATREICWSVRERLQTSYLGISEHMMLQRDTTNALRMWILSTSACSACRRPAAGNLVGAHKTLQTHCKTLGSRSLRQQPLSYE